MIVSDKTKESSQRTKYIRLLERFFYSIVNSVSKSDEMTKESFIKKVNNNRKYLDKAEAVALFKTELVELENCVKKIFELSISDENTTIDDIKNSILRSANSLEKNKNKNSYKKEKHKNSKFDEWD